MKVSDKTYLRLLVKGPRTLFCFFNVSPADINAFNKKYGISSWDNSKPFLRLLCREGSGSKVFETIQLDPFANNWYINLDEALEGKEIYLELGRRLPEAEAITAAVSNSITVPASHPSEDRSIYYINVSALGSTCDNNTEKQCTAAAYDYFRQASQEDSIEGNFFIRYFENIDLNDVNSSS